MVRENPALTFWDRLLPHYLQRDWDACIRELRPVLDADEDALVPRLLCAGLHLAAGQPVQALVQYETLLPLAVGQGDFFAAIAVQKRLDQLHPTSVTHARRYEVLRRWFLSLGRSAVPAEGERLGDLSEASLIALDAHTFNRAMLECTLEGLDPAERTFTGDLSSGRVALYGRAVWALRMGEEVTLLEGIAERGQSIAVDPGVNPIARLIVTAELPTEFLVFTAVATAPSHSADAADAADATVEPAAAPPPNEPQVAPPDAAEPEHPAEGGSGPRRARQRERPAREPRAKREPPPRAERPQLDPRFEPFMAVFAPAQRRRESRIAINLESGVARIGLVDTRVAPIGGRLTQLGVDRIEMVFSRADLRHLRARLEGSVLALQLNLGPGEPPLDCTGRVRWTSALGDGTHTNDLKIELEVLPLRAAERERLARAARRFAAGSSGTPPAKAA